MKEILDSRWMLSDERELAAEYAKKFPNMSWSNFRDQINRKPLRQKCPMAKNWLFTELKYFGCNHDGKMLGYRLPKEKQLKKYYFVKGFLEKVAVVPTTEIVYNNKEEVQNEKTLVQNSAEAVQINSLNNQMAIVLLKFFYKNKWKISSSAFRKTYGTNNNHLTSEGIEYLLKEGILKKEGTGLRTRYSLAVPEDLLLEIYPFIQDEITEADLLAVGSKSLKPMKVVVTTPKETQPPRWKSVLDQSVQHWLDELTHPYSRVEMGVLFNLDSENAYELEQSLLEKGILIETASRDICPSFIWQNNVVEKTPEEPRTVAINKAIVFECEKVRILNESKSKIDVVICDSEVVIKIK